jgi:peptide/nickel transport system ATP-binding protein
MTDAALFEVRDLSVSYGAQAVVDSISLEVAPGRCLGVIGESGAGKSQAFLALLGLSGQRATVSGHARLRGADLMGQGAASLRGRRIAMIFQDPLTSLTPHLRIGEQLAEPLRIHRGFSRAEAMTRAAELLRSVRVGDVARRLRQYPHELSGGMRQRVMIAMALACDPELLIADEPTTALDVSVQAQLLALLRQIITERRMSLIVVSHDMGVIATLADDVAVMRAGRIVERGPVQDILANPTHEYTRALIAATPRMDGPVPLPDRAPAPTDAVLDVQSLVVDHSLRAPLWRRAPALRAVDGVSLNVERGQALGVVGESGCGKSTLARALLRLHDATAGDILWRGRSIRALAGERLLPVRSDLQLVFQDPVASLDPLQRVQDIVEEPLRALRPALDAPQRAERARAMLAAVGLGAEYLGRRSRELSGGQCQRVAIARAMVLEPQLLVCDEAVSSLDVSIQAQILELLAGFKRDRGTAIVFVSHNLAVVKQLCERVVVMYLGRVVESGPTREVFQDPRHPYTRLLLESVPLLDPLAGRARLTMQEAAAELPSALDRPAGCAFHLRCPIAQDRCAAQRPETEHAGEHREVACWRWREGSRPVPNEK